MGEGRETIETGVDQLLRLVKKHNRIAIPSLARHLKTEQAVVQTWVDFLVEEQVLAIEYKLFTPYVYLIRKSESSKQIRKKDPLQIKQEFYEKAKQKNIPTPRIHALWKQYLTNNIVEIKERFVERARSKGLDTQATEKAWNKYKLYLLDTNAGSNKE